MAFIAIVEDDENIAELIRASVKTIGHEAQILESAPKLFALLSEQRPDLILLDIMLPEMNGLEIIKKLKANTATQNIPVIFLTARDDEGSVVMGLDLGADDYITKPFRIRELISRIRSVLRRYNKSSSGSLYTFGNVQVNTVQGKVTKNGKDVFLTALEYRLLLTFINHEGHVLSRAQLLESIWDVSGDFVNDNTLTVYIKRLREKIEDDPQNPTIIKTVRGMGYQL